MSDQDLEARVRALESQLEELRTQLMESQLDEWKARIDQLEVQAHLGEMEAADQINPLLDQLRNRWLDAQDQFDKAQSNGRRRGLDRARRRAQRHDRPAQRPVRRGEQGHAQALRRLGGACWASSSRQRPGHRGSSSSQPTQLGGDLVPVGLVEHLVAGVGPQPDGHRGARLPVALADELHQGAAEGQRVRGPRHHVDRQPVGHAVDLVLVPQARARRRPWCGWRPRPGRSRTRGRPRRRRPRPRHGSASRTRCAPARRRR